MALTRFPKKYFTYLMRKKNTLFHLRTSLFSNLWTYFKLKSNKVIFGKEVRGNSFYIYNQGNILLGDNVYLHSYPNGSSIGTALNTYFPDATIKVGKNSRLNGTVIHCNEKVVIGENCLFGPGTVIVDNDSHRVIKEYQERIKPPKSKPIKIGNNVWLGMNCIV